MFFNTDIDFRKLTRLKKHVKDTRGDKVKEYLHIKFD